MNFNRHRHIFTLGSLRKSKRWQATDLFESDPFKIHSYNFRYAERPSLPMPVLRNRRKSYEASNDFETYFYNHDFSHATGLNVAGNANDRRLLNLAKFQEYRRRRFLNSARSYRSCHLRGTEHKSFNLNHNPSTSKILNSYTDQGNVNTIPSFVKQDNCNINFSNTHTNNTTQACPSTRQSFQNEHYLTAPSSPAIRIDNRRIPGSGCEININIKGLENDRLDENVNINIGTDSVCKNLSIPLAKTMRNSNLSTGLVEQSKQSKSFVIDKRLSKFCLAQDRPNDVRKTGKERTKELTAIYSSQMLAKSSRADYFKSRERLPSLLPLKTHSVRDSSLTFINGSVASKKSIIQRVKDNLSVYDNNVHKKNYSSNNLKSSSYKLGHRESKASNSFSRKLPMTSSSKRVCSKSTLRSTARLPLNININVFADKLKG